MKLTKTQLKQIIKEELEETLDPHQGAGPKTLSAAEIQQLIDAGKDPGTWYDPKANPANWSATVAKAVLYKLEKFQKSLPELSPIQTAAEVRGLIDDIRIFFERHLPGHGKTWKWDKDPELW